MLVGGWEHEKTPGHLAVRRVDTELDGLLRVWCMTATRSAPHQSVITRDGNAAQHEAPASICACAARPAAVFFVRSRLVAGGRVIFPPLFVLYVESLVKYTGGGSMKRTPAPSASPACSVARAAPHGSRSHRYTYGAFGVFGTMCGELEWKTLIFSGREVPKTPNAS